MSKYKIREDGVLIREDGAQIPSDPENRDRQEFSDWQAAGNSPEQILPEPVEVVSPLDKISTSEAISHLIDAIKDAVNDKGLVDLQLSDVEDKATAALTAGQIKGK